MRILAQNKKAFHDYFIEETYNAGIVLTGTEIKSIRKGSVNLKDSYVHIKDGEAYILNMHIAPYEEGNRFNHDPLRTRKLLLNKKEIYKLLEAIREDGYTLVATKLFIDRRYAKVEVAVAKGKKLYDKRQVEKEKVAKKEMARAIKGVISGRY